MRQRPSETLQAAAAGALGSSGADHHPLVARSEDPLVVKEVHVTTYHVLWELAHVLFEQPGVLDPEVVR
jgi:D-sedoheptulose 7-phosphate isomerase